MGQKRRTYDGRVTDYDTMTQQHLSNIFWYNNILMDDNVDNELLRQIDNRFGGVILPYKPVLEFKLEIKALHKRGFLMFNELENRWEVTFQHVVVGFMDETKEQVDEVLYDTIDKVKAIMDVFSGTLNFGGTALAHSAFANTFRTYASALLNFSEDEEGTDGEDEVTDESTVSFDIETDPVVSSRSGNNNFISPGISIRENN